MFYENKTIDDKVLGEINLLHWKAHDDELYEFLVKQVAKQIVELKWLSRQGEAKAIHKKLFKQGNGSLGFLVSTQHVFQLAFNEECCKRDEEDTKDGELGRGSVLITEMMGVMFDSLKPLYEQDADTSKDPVVSKTPSAGEDWFKA